MIQLNGTGIGVGVLILTVMITPIMIAIMVDALRAVPRSWTEGAAALGANRWRVVWTVVLRTARPAIIAATVLATARALGEAIMLAMVTGLKGFAPNPIDGITFLFEPTKPLAAAIVQNVEGLSVVPFGADALRVRRGPPGLEHVPLPGRLGRQAAHAQVRDPAVSDARPPAALRRESWPLIDRLGYGWPRAGIGLCVDRGFDRHATWPTGALSTSISACSRSAPAADLDQSKSGGFMDPLIGTGLLRSSAP